MEFKRLSDVEVVAEPTESANVLIEEDGVIKRAPKTEVGGAGGGEIMDIILGVNGLPSFLYCGSVDINRVTILEGSMEAARSAYAEGRIPKGKVVFTNGEGVTEYGIYGNVSEVPAEFYFYGEYMYMCCVSNAPLYEGYIYRTVFCFNSDGAIERIDNRRDSWGMLAE